MPLTSPSLFTTFLTVTDFPSYATLKDDFNRANTGPPPSASWTAWLSPGLKVDSNQLAPFDSGDNGAYFNTSIGPNLEAYITLSTLPIAGGEIGFPIRANPTGSAFNGTYYWISYTVTTHKLAISVRPVDGGAVTDLVSTTAFTLVNGDKIGARCVGSKIELWIFNSGYWTLACSAIDTTFSGASPNNKIGVYIFGNGGIGARLDDFYAEVVPVAPTTDSGTAPLKLTPSSVETEQGVDSGTARLSLTPSSVELFAGSFIDSGTVLLAFTPSALETHVIPIPAPPQYQGGQIPETIIPGPPPRKTYWTIIHYRHDGTALGDEYPNALEFSLYLGKMGSVSYDLDKASSLCIKENTEPYGTDYILKYGDREIQGGIHTDIQIDDIEGHTFQISGKDWMHWFEGQKWPFDPNNPLANVYSQFGRDMFLVVEDWLTVIQSEADTIQFTYSNGTSGQTVNAKIDHSDTEDMLSKITTLSQGNPGFDFEITPDKHFNMYYPNKSRDIDLVLEQGANIYQLSYHNKGPTGTRIFGQAQGPSSRLGSIQDHIKKSYYRRWMVNEDFGDVPDVATLAQRTSGALERAASPHLEFTARIIPDFVEDIFDYIELGDNIPVYGRLGWDTIDDRFRLVSISGTISDEGDQEFELGFDDGTISL